MSATTTPAPAQDAEARQGLGTAFIIFVVAVVLLFAGTYTYVFLSSKPVNTEPIWTGSGTVISQQIVPGTRKVNENCYRFCTYVATKTPQLTIRADSGEVVYVPVTQREYDAIGPGQTYTRK